MHILYVTRFLKNPNPKESVGGKKEGEKLTLFLERVLVFGEFPLLPVVVFASGGVVSW